MKNPYINDEPCGEISGDIENLKTALVNYSIKHSTGDVLALPMCILNTVVESLAHYEEKARRLENLAHAYMDLTAETPLKSFDLCSHLIRPLSERIVEPQPVEGTNIIKLIRK